VAATTVKALILDLDGTFLRTDKTVSLRNRRAVQRCSEAGIAVIVATARPPRAVRKYLANMPWVDCLVYYNGALVTWRSTNMERHTPISNELSRRVTAFIRAQRPESMIVYEVHDAWYTGAPIPDTTRDALGIGATDPTPAVVDESYAAALSPTKILVQGFDEWRDLREEFHQALNIMATDGGALVQIMHVSVSKESAVAWVLNDMGITPVEAMVFGDDVNDVGLFRLCGFPVAMGNAIPELREAAAFITESNDEDGVAVAIEKWVECSS